MTHRPAGLNRQIQRGILHMRGVRIESVRITIRARHRLAIYYRTTNGA